jgi:ABC-type polar amino acid transport system ATPase subunit
VIEVRGIKKAFGDQEVLKGIDMDLKPGQCNLIIGSSGSGKTVMLKSIVGLIQPDEGQVLLDGRDWTAMKEHDRKVLRQEMGTRFLISRQSNYGLWRSHPPSRRGVVTHEGLDRSGSLHRRRTLRGDCS